MTKSILPIVQRLAVFLVGVCISFHSVTIPIGRPMSLSVLSMAVYALSLSPFFPDFFKIGKVFGKTFLIPFYFIIYLTFVNVLNVSEYSTPIFNQTLFLCFLLFSFFLIHIKHDSKAMRICIWGLAFGGVLLAVFAILGIGVEVEMTEMRLKVFGVNSNTVGIILAITFIIIVNEYIVLDVLHLGTLKFTFIIALVPVISTLLLTGSRTALFIMGFSAIIAVLLYPSKSKSKKVIVLLIGAISFYFIVNSFLQSDSIMVDRFLDFMENKDMSGRDDIWANYMPYFIDNPILGYGETGYAVISNNVVGILNVDESGKAYGYSPHNVIVELLLLTGIIGLAMWMVFWKKLFRYAWVSYKTYNEMTPLLMWLPLLASILSGQILMTTHAYIVYAYFYSEYCRLKGLNKMI